MLPNNVGKVRMCKVKRVGPSTESCGTPCLILLCEEETSCTCAGLDQIYLIDTSCNLIQIMEQKLLILVDDSSTESAEVYKSMTAF